MHVRGPAHCGAEIEVKLRDGRTYSFAVQDPKGHPENPLSKKQIEQKIKQAEEDYRAAEKKARRDKLIHERGTIRTYDYKTGVVRDHRTGKRSTIKRVLGKGCIEDLADF